MGKSFVYNTGAGEDDTTPDNLNLNFGIFIDGTLNNMYNTDLRLEYSRGGDTNPNRWNLTNAEIERWEDARYDYVPNKDKIEDLLAIENRTKAEQTQLDNMPEEDVYFVASHRDFMGKMGTDNSYSNDYTNVARMWTCCDENYDIYVEGMGTKKNSRDDDEGFQFGSGSVSGIRARVREACDKLADNIQIGKEFKKKLKVITVDVFGFSRGAASARNFVSEINFNKGVYRATKVGEYEYKVPKKEEKPQTVRDNIPQQQRIIDNPYRSFNINNIPKAPIVKKDIRSIYHDRDGQLVNGSYIINGYMPKFGHLGISLLEKGVVKSIEELNELTIVVRFLGIYDTVSSFEEIGPMGGDNTHIKGIKHLVNSYFTDDEKQLNLQNMGEIQKIVHFTAKDEHRENFALTRVSTKYNRIDDNGDNRLVERNFPGVHCDIGGAYLNEIEEIDEIETTAFLKLETSDTASGELRNLRQELIWNHWFYDNEIQITKPFWYYPLKVIELFSLMSFRFKTAYLAKQAAYEALSSKRNVKKEYSYIPLHFMGGFCKPLITDKYMPDNVEVNYSILGNTVLEQAKSYLKTHVLEQNKEWDFKSDFELLTTKEIIDKHREVPPEKVRDNIPNKPKFDYEKQKAFEKKLELEEEKRLRSIREYYGYGTTEKRPLVSPIEKAEVEIDYTSQELLRKLRHEYFHWSSNRDWFGMDHAKDRIREEYPKK
ncbi:phospholipase effector Tle1 domain-containing protein [Flavobacterium sp. PL002]|uniref:phospholipase effector Tle1 domain-containing protein n=1 Tax=Flavobacterium sp. PL002 TaxID=1897058 RepID=UPI00178826D8|nr:DUF2235 domain-containing protein [Flavobacterium sp. PL002]MBE0392682.1 hypothetical protein [Flavobacterium sp. PL002]